MPAQPRRRPGQGAVVAGHHLVDAQTVHGQSLGHRRHDQRQAGGGLDLGQLFDEAVQPAQLPARRRVDLDAGDQRGDVVGVHLEARDVGDDPPAPQDCDPVGEVEHLLETMGNQEDGRASVAELGEQLLHRAGLAHSERRRRLVEHDHRRVAPHRSGDGDELALASRQRADQLERVDDGDPEALEEGTGLVEHGDLVEQPTADALSAQEEVGDHAEVVAEREVLPHHRHVRVTVGPRLGRVPQLHHPGVGGRGAVDAAHQRGLAGTVLSHEGEDLRGVQRQVDSAEDRECPEALVNAADDHHGTGGRLRHPPSLPKGQIEFPAARPRGRSFLPELAASSLRECPVTR
jgi:hypothetical protein